MSIWFEVVWAYGGCEYVLATTSSREHAEQEWRSGPARVRQKIYGGSLRVDECRVSP